MVSVNFLRRAALACAVVFCSLFALAQQETAFTVNVESAPGFKQDGGFFLPLAEVWNVDGAAPLAIQAEGFDEVTFMPGGKVRSEGEVSSLVSYKRARYYYNSAAARTVAVWVRVRGLKDGGAMVVNGHQFNIAKDAEKPNEWRWVKLGDRQIAAGFGSFQFVSVWPPAPEMDQFALMNGDETPDNPPLAKKTPVTAYSILSEEVRLPALQSLKSATAISDGEEATLEASADGAAWGAPKDIPLAGKLRLRATFKEKPTWKTAISGFTARVAYDPAKYLILDNGKVSIGIDTVNAGVFRIESPELKTAFATPQQAGPLFSIDLKDRGKPWKTPGKTNETSRGVILEPKDGVLESAQLHIGNARDLIEMKYNFLGGKIGVTARITLFAMQFDSEWTLAIDNKSDSDVVVYTYPRVQGMRVGANGYDDFWLNTNIIGPWPACERPLDRTYPGWGPLGFADLYDERAGISFALRDIEEGLTRISFDPMGYRSSQSGIMQAEKRHCVTKDEQRTWSYNVLIHQGDWHAAADAYGEWFRGMYGVADHWPEWVKDANGWMFDNSCLRDKTFKWEQLLDTYEQGRRLGLKHVQVWGQFGSSSCGTFYWPSPKYGDIEKFAEVNKKIVDMGGHVGYYFAYDRDNRYNQIDTEMYDGYLPRTAYPKDVPLFGADGFVKSGQVDDATGKITSWPQNDKEMQEFKDSLKKLLTDKALYTWYDKPDGDNTWPKTAMAMMNPADPDWQDWLVKWTIDKYKKQWHADTFYMDVLGCNSLESFDPRLGDHNHYRHGETAIAKKLFEAGRAVDPNFAYSCEGRAEMVNRWAMSMNSSSNWAWIYTAPYRYTHPDFVMFMGGNNGGYLDMQNSIELAYLYGCRFDMMLTGDVAFLRKITRFRENFKRFALRSTFRDTVGITFSGEGIDATRHDRFADDCKAALVTVVNRRNVEDGMLTVNTEKLGDEYAAFWLTLDGAITRAQFPPNMRPARNTFVTVIPESRISALLLVGQVPKGEELLGTIDVALTPMGRKTTGYLANLTNEKRNAGVSQVTKMPGGGMMNINFDIPLEPYGITTNLPQATVGGAENFGDVTLEVDGKVIAANYLYPLVEDGSFEKMGTPMNDAPHGAKVLHLGPSKEWQGHAMGLNVAPGHTYKLSVQGRRTGDNGKHIYGLIRIQDGDGKWDHKGLYFKAGEGINTWVTLTQEFTTPADMKASDIYLYNWDSEETVDWDNVTVQMVK